MTAIKQFCLLHRVVNTVQNSSTSNTQHTQKKVSILHSIITVVLQLSDITYRVRDITGRVFPVFVLPLLVLGF